MDIVAHAGTVSGGIIAAENRELLPQAAGSLGDIGHQVVGDTAGMLADPAAGVGARRVEVAQDGNIPGALRGVQVSQHFLDHQLAAPVGIGRGQREILVDGIARGVTVDRGR